MSATVTAVFGVRLRLAGMPDPVPVTVTLSYTEADPYAVNVAFHVGLDEPKVWMFARDLLAQGLQADAGEGDVRVWPQDADVVGVGLSSPYGEATFEFPAPEVAGFLVGTYQLVPRGREPGAAGAELDGLFLPGGALHQEGGRS